MVVECVLIDLVRNRLLWLDSHLFALLSWDMMRDDDPLEIIDRFNEDDRGLAGVAVFGVT